MLQLTTATTANHGSIAWTPAMARAATYGGHAAPLRLSTDTAERRREVRIAQARPVKILDAVGGRTLVGETVDVSATGLRLRLSPGQSLRVGEVLGVYVGPSRIGDKLANRRQLIPVRVVWVSDTRRNGSLVAGVEFTTGVGAQLDAA